MIRKFFTNRYLVNYRYDFIEKHATSGLTLNIGCYQTPYSRYFPNIEMLDIIDRPGVKYLCDVHDMRIIPDNKYDCVLCTEVLEHVHDPVGAISEMRRVLRPGGRVIITTRFMFPKHDCPEDYYRYTDTGLIHLLRDFRVVDVGTEGALFSTIARIVQFVDSKNSRRSLFLLVVAKILYLLSYVCKYPGASGYYIVGEK